MSIISRKRLTRQAFRGALALALAATASQSHAVRFGTPNGVSGSFDVLLSYSNMFRVEDKDPDLIGHHTNGDDGSNNYDKGELVSNMFRVVAEFGIENKASPSTSYGFFTRGYALYDAEIQDRGSDYDDSLYMNHDVRYDGDTSSGGQGFTDGTQNRLGSTARLQDIFVYANLFQDTDHPVSLKLGRQVVNWGENMMIQSGILNAINPADISRADIPGTEIKEILLPTNAISVSIGLTENIGFSAYYQFEFRGTVPPSSGSYFSDLDFLGPGADNLLLNPWDDGLPAGSDLHIASMERQSDITDDDGQYGFALTWYSEALWETEFGFYVLNYHDKLPTSIVFTMSEDGNPDQQDILASADYSMYGPGAGFVQSLATLADTSFYQFEHVQDITLYGVSFNTALPTFGFLDSAMSGEIAWRKNAAVQTRATSSALPQGLVGYLGGADPATQYRAVERTDLISANLSFFELLDLPWLADSVELLFEVAAVSAPNADEVFRGPDQVDDFAWGYKSLMMLTYFEALTPIHPVFTGTDLKVNISWNQDVDGYSPIAAGSFSEGEKSLGITVMADWQAHVSVGLTYSRFWWDEQMLRIGDRDYVAFTAQYVF